MTTKLKATLWGLAVLTVAAVGFYAYTQTATYAAGRHLAEAEAAFAQQDFEKAAYLYGTVALSGTDHARQGRSGLRSLLDDSRLSEQPAAAIAMLAEQTLRANARTGPMYPEGPLLALAWETIEARAQEDPVGAKRLLDAIAGVESDRERVVEKNEQLLERIVATAPDNVAAAAELAEILEVRGEFARCEQLLAPHADSLGSGEAARILGQIYAAQGRIEESYRLLRPYTHDRLQQYRALEQAYYRLYDDLWDATLEELQAGMASSAFYDAYERADEVDRRELVQRYINRRLEQNPALEASLEAVQEAAAIVPAAFDLALVMMHRAHNLSDPQERQAQLEAAEETFLAIQGFAADSDEYWLYLGQVYYWLGRQEEGRQIFDELLEAYDRSYDVLTGISGVLRALGAVSEARTLVEEAYAQATTDEQRRTAAHMRSVMFIDVEDEIVWLERADQSDTRIRASLHTARGHLALDKGQHDVAEKAFRQALKDFAELPESPSRLNSIGLVHLALYSLQGEREQLQQGIAHLDRALALMPTDSILLLNNLSALESAVVTGLVDDAIDLSLLKHSANFGLLEHLHADSASLEALRGAFLANEAAQKLLDYSEKAILLAPDPPRTEPRYAFTISR
ncbi:hypothetical protein CAI21_19755 [Alkalilimnicola ehrlichii]|uniref:tetratricopeptide repeat protein n=1 Tax=Alkalilimnicola ehrlichii TaxID=351052 RepID=UPI000E2EC01C|nr:tetratricopeptide repeat protein [Alkalilimnicola ehrlichii]RFA25207.1 hypothetical protein CAI21_19755 [Alkalilimnicola ehrlichii]